MATKSIVVIWKETFSLSKLTNKTSLPEQYPFIASEEEKRIRSVTLISLVQIQFMQ